MGLLIRGSCCGYIYVYTRGYESRPLTMPLPPQKNRTSADRPLSPSAASVTVRRQMTRHVGILTVLCDQAKLWNGFTDETELSCVFVRADLVGESGKH